MKYQYDFTSVDRRVKCVICTKNNISYLFFTKTYPLICSDCITRFENLDCDFALGLEELKYNTKLPYLSILNDILAEYKKPHIIWKQELIETWRKLREHSKKTN